MRRRQLTKISPLPHFGVEAGFSLMIMQNLRTLLYNEAKKLSENAAQTPESVTKEQVEQLERLARLAELAEKTAPKPKPKRWPTVIILAATALIVSLLLFFRVPSTKIEMEMGLSECQFRLSKQAALTNAMVLASLGVSELQEIRLPRSTGRATETLTLAAASQQAGLALRVSAASDAAEAGTVTLATLVLPAATRISLRRMDVPNQFRLVVNLPEASRLMIQVNVKGGIEIAPSGAAAETYQFAIPSAIQLRPLGTQVFFDMMLTKAGEAAFAANLPVSDLAFARDEKIDEQDDTLTRPVSTMLTGKVYLSEISRREYAFRTGEILQFRAFAGAIWQLRMQREQIDMMARGRVTGVASGWEESRSSIMPTYLEWILARTAAMLLWSQTVSLFFLLLGIWNWWKKTE